MGLAPTPIAGGPKDQSPSPNPLAGLVATGTPWQARLRAIVEMMRELSRQNDPQAMVRAYGERVRQLMPVDGSVSISRRGLSAPHFRVTRFSGWSKEINPWTQRDRLPLISGGLLADIAYADEPRIIDDLDHALDPSDPAASYVQGHRSLMALPNYDQGHALNWTIMLRNEPAAFEHEQLPERVWMSNLFGRATQNLVLNEELRQAYATVDRELKVVADIQRSLLPRQLPAIPRLDVAAHYQTSRWAGGDYYDFFPLPEGRWGLLIADVSGHGTPAAVLMAITHTIAHDYPGDPSPPGRLLGHVNRHLAHRYTMENEAFVTAFYGIFDPSDRTLLYASAGHNPPRVKRCQDGSIHVLDEVGGVPLGLTPDVEYDEGIFQLEPADQLVLYTDGITEALDPRGRLFGLDRLDRALETCGLAAQAVIDSILEAVERFAGDEPVNDDRTLIVGRVS